MHKDACDNLNVLIFNFISPYQYEARVNGVCISQVTYPRLLQFRTAVLAPTATMTCRIDHAHGISIYDSSDKHSQSLHLHCLLSQSKENHYETRCEDVTKRYHCHGCLTLPPFLKISGGHRAFPGLVATMQYASCDGFITNPCKTQESIDLLGKGVSILSGEDHIEPPAIMSTADVAAAATSNNVGLHTKTSNIYLSLPKAEKTLKVFHDSHKDSEVMMQGLCFIAIHSVSSATHDVALDHQYIIEWQTCIPGGA